MTEKTQLEKHAKFLEHALEIVTEAKEMSEEDIIPISRISYLEGYLRGGLNVIKWELERINAK